MPRARDSPCDASTDLVSLGNSESLPEVYVKNERW